MLAAPEVVKSPEPHAPPLKAAAEAVGLLTAKLAGEGAVDAWATLLELAVDASAAIKLTEDLGWLTSLELAGTENAGPARESAVMRAMLGKDCRKPAIVMKIG